MIRGAIMIEAKKTKKTIETVQFGKTIERSTVEMATSATMILF